MGDNYSKSSRSSKKRKREKTKTHSCLEAKTEENLSLEISLVMIRVASPGTKPQKTCYPEFGLPKEKLPLGGC